MISAPVSIRRDRRQAEIELRPARAALAAARPLHQPLQLEVGAELPDQRGQVDHGPVPAFVAKQTNRVPQFLLIADRPNL